MEIYLKNTETNESIRFPYLPEEIAISSGMNMARYTVLSLGDVSIPNGRTLKSVAWEGLLPGDARRNEPWYKGDFIEPAAISKKLESWMISGAKCTLIITDTNINQEFYIAAYSPQFQGGHGDYHYTISFEEYRSITIQTATVEAEKFPVVSSQRSNSGGGGTYTVVKGDSLWKIAQMKLGSGSRWPEIYNLNKATIGSNPNLIYPGQKFILPGGSGTGTGSGSSSSSSNKIKPEGTTTGGTPPFKIIDKNNNLVRSGFPTLSTAQSYYNSNGGAQKGWQILDNKNAIVMNSTTGGTPPYKITDRNNTLVRGGFPTTSSALTYYNANDGKQKGWRILDTRNAVVYS